MKNRNEIVTKHYISNYTLLVKRMIWRVPHKSRALAEEVVQEAYLNAMLYFRTYNPQIKDFDVWFRTIMNNVLKKYKREESNSGVTYEYDENSEELSVSRDLNKDVLLEGIHKSKFSDQEVLRMFFILGFTSKEISDFLNKNHNTVRQIIMRFRIKIKDEILTV